MKVPGALQLKTSAAKGHLPVTSASMAYSSWLKPDTLDRKRFHKPSPCAFSWVKKIDDFVYKPGEFLPINRIFCFKMH